MFYTFLVDESGEAGINKIRSKQNPGASPYMTLGGVLIPDTHLEKIKKNTSIIKKEIGKELHCSTLDHNQKVYFSREISKEKILLFGVISRKKTLGDYKQVIDSNSKLYYNKCAGYLLENLGHFANEAGINQSRIKIIFEEGNFDYPSLRNYVRACQTKPLNPRAEYLKNIHAGNIETQKKSENELLPLADLVAHALFKCVEKNEKNFSIPEPRYLQELSKKFFNNKEDKKVVSYGIKAIHKLNDLLLDKDIHNFLEKMTVDSG